MFDALSATVSNATPTEAWEALATTQGSALLDVRTRAEWAFAGMPDLSAIGREVWTVEWATWPSLTPNLGFISDLQEQMGDEVPTRLFVLCRMGAKSPHAARAIAQQMLTRGSALHVTNICDGFEGQKHTNGQRGLISGWKAAGLPWRHA